MEFGQELSPLIEPMNGRMSNRCEAFEGFRGGPSRANILCGVPDDLRLVRRLQSGASVEGHIQPD